MPYLCEHHLLSGNVVEEGAERMYDLGDSEEFCETLSSGYNMALALMSAQQVWFLVQDLHTVEPDNIPAGQGGPATSEEIIGS